MWWVLWLGVQTMGVVWLVLVCWCELSVELLLLIITIHDDGCCLCMHAILFIDVQWCWC